MVDLVAARPGMRVLDVACGTGKQPMRIAERRCSAVGTEASAEMIGLGRWIHPESRAQMVRSIAEALPFRNEAFDVVMCQGSLDHFADQAAFMSEAARITRTGGSVVIALANFESLSCRLGRSLDALKRRLNRPRPPWRRYWQIPEDHTVKGDLPYVRGLGGPVLRLERAFGVSLLWNAPGYTWLADHVPPTLADRTCGALDRLARSRPQHADTIISVWRK